MTAEYNMKNLLAFIDKNAMPKVMFFNEKAAEKIFTTYIPTMFLIFNQNDEAATTSAKKNFEQFAKSKDFDHFQFCTAQHDDMMGERLVEFFGITEKQLPIFVIIEFTETNLLKFFQDARIGVDGIQQFVQNYFDKKLQPYFKSEEVPEKNDDPVYVLVGKTYEKIVKDETKDVLVLFYAPWCQHCKRFHPHYEKLAQTIKQVNPHILLAKIDGSANEIQGIDLQGFPTLYFYPKNNKTEPILFEKERSQEGLVEFLKEKASAWNDVKIEPIKEEEETE